MVESMVAEISSAEMAQYRTSMYASASAAFMSEPTADQLRAMVAASCEASRAGEGFLSEGEAALIEHLCEYEGIDAHELRVRVATEYAELFVGPRAPLAPLYESVYVGPVSRLNTQVTMRVREFYERCGLQVARRDSLPNDHLALELEFLSELAAREADALERGDDVQAREARELRLGFLREHSLAWIDAFCSRIGEAWCADYYEAWARFAQFLIHDDARELERYSTTSAPASLRSR